MLLVKRATKPLGVGSIVKVTPEALRTYGTKKSGTFNDRLTDKKFIVLGKVNSCEQKIIRVIEIQTGSYPDGNASQFRYQKKQKLRFISLSSIEDSKQTYFSIFGTDGRLEVQAKLLNAHGLNITKV
jgi:hypothetical protein